MFEQGVDVTAAAGAGYKVLQVVNGHTDLYYHSTHIKKWDLCAGGQGRGGWWAGQVGVVDGGRSHVKGWNLCSCCSSTFHARNVVWLNDLSR